MRRAQLLVWESDGRLAETLRECAAKQQWALHEVRQADACLGYLRHGGRNVLVVKVGRDLEAEFVLLEQITRRFPEASVVVVGDGDNPGLTDVAWDLGVNYVLVPPQPRHWLVDIVTGLMKLPAKHSEDDS